MKSLKRWWPYLFFAFLILVIFRKFFFQGLLPIPYNIMVAWHFPYSLGGWVEHNLIIPHKGGLFAGDVYRQMIPWKELSLDLIRQGELPLWNPYAFSGEPLLANIQATIFNPLSLIFFVVPQFDFAWSLYIIAAPIIALLGMFCWGRALGWQKISSTAMALGFAFSGFMLSWLEWGVVSHSAIWLPWALWGLTEYFKKFQRRHLLVIGLSVYSTILGGYPQISTYILLIILIYFLTQIYGQKLTKEFLTKISLLALTSLITLIVALPQLAPTGQLYLNSALNGEVSQQLFLKTQIHPFHLMNFFASEYFGNRIYDNYWADILDQVDYPNAFIFVGTTSVVFILLALLARRKHKLEYFGLVLISLGLVIAIKSPVSDFVGSMAIPMISTGVAANSLILATFGLVVLIGAGFERFIKRRYNFGHLVVIFLIIAGFGVSLLFVPAAFRQSTIKNSLIPLAILLTSLASGLVWLKYYKQIKFLKLGLIGLIFLMYTGENIIFGQKLLSFSPAKYSYPEHILVEQLRQFSDYDRVAGFWDSKLWTNMPTAWGLYSPEGYNPLHPRWYQELSSGQRYLGYPETIIRSDVDILPDEVEGRNRFMQLTSTKYIAASVTNPDNLWEEDPLKYDPKIFKLIWQEGKFKIYEYLNALDRVKLYAQHISLTDDRQRLDYIYSSDFDPETEVVLESQLDLLPNPDATGSAKLISYSPNQVEIEVSVKNGPMILLLTDTYYPSWRAYVNDQEVKIYRANHAFRAIVVPDGASRVKYKINWP